MKKLKIAQVVSGYEPVPPSGKNGLEFIVSWLTDELVRRGHDVTLFAPGDSVTQARLVSLLPHGSSELGFPVDEKNLFSLWNTIIAAQQNFDIIHCHNQNGAFITELIKTPIIETIHHPIEGDPFLKKLHDMRTDSGLLAPATHAYEKLHYACISKFQETKFQAYEQTVFKNHRTIYNGIPVEKFEFNDKPSDYFLYIGYINKNKGADVAVRIAHTLGLKLMIAGSYLGEEKFFEEQIRPFLSEKIVYVGAVDFAQKNELYKNARAKLAPLSWHEPFGLTLVEAQACGTPVIAFSKGAAAEIVKDGVTGFIVNTEAEMIEAIRKIESIDRKACRTWVEENFTVEKMTDKYETYYRSLIK